MDETVRVEAREMAKKRGVLSRWVDLNCLYCGKDFKGAPGRKFCSRDCLNRSRTRGVLTTCANPDCGVRFRKEKGYKTYCSWDCYKRDIPRMLEEVDEKRAQFLADHEKNLADGGEWIEYEKSLLFIDRNTNRDLMSFAISKMARFDEGVTAFELGELLGFRFGERVIMTEPMMKELEAKTSLIERVHHKTLMAWVLTEDGMRKVRDG